MVKKTVIYWRDIPSQVVAQHGRIREKVRLSDRFQEAIDRAAMRAGKGSSDLYIAEWRRETVECEGNDPGEIAASEARKIEDDHSDDRLLELVRNHGSAEK